MGFINQLITRGHHPVRWLGNTENVPSLCTVLINLCLHLHYCLQLWPTFPLFCPRIYWKECVLVLENDAVLWVGSGWSRVFPQKSSHLHGSAIMKPLEWTACVSNSCRQLAVRIHASRPEGLPWTQAADCKRGFLIWFETQDSTQKLVNFHRNRASSHSIYTKPYNIYFIHINSDWLESTWCVFDSQWCQWRFWRSRQAVRHYAFWSLADPEEDSHAGIPSETGHGAWMYLNRLGMYPAAI